MADRYAEFAKNTYAAQVHKIADALRAAADAIAREKVTPRLGPGDNEPDHTWHAAKVVKELQDTFGTLPLDRLLEAASEADAAVREDSE